MIVTGRPSSLAAAGEVAGARWPPRMAELRTSCPSIVNGGTTTTSKPSRAPELGERRRRAATLEAEGRVGGHDEARELDPRADPLDEDVVRRVPQGVVEVLDDRDRHAGRREPLEPFLGIEQERRRRPRQDLVRDDGRR